MESKISAAVVRLKRLRLYLGLTQAEFAERLGFSKFTVPSWENGAKNFGALSARRVIKALAQQLDFICAFDWLLKGEGYSPILLSEIQAETSKFANEVALVKQLNPHLTIIKVVNELFMPLATVGDYVGLVPIKLTRGLEQVVYLINHQQ